MNPNCKRKSRAQKTDLAAYHLLQRPSQKINILKRKKYRKKKGGEKKAEFDQILIGKVVETTFVRAI